MITQAEIDREIERIADAVGVTPTVTLAAAHVYPAAAPAWKQSPGAERERPPAGPVRLYAHIPFCNYKCTFCYYATRVGDSPKRQDRYVAALERELRSVDSGTPLSQLFMGGGTPTAMAPELLDRLLASIFDRLPPEPGRVHTVEASPESVTDEHVRVLRDRGVGRVSMGVQSLDDRVLDVVHRRHDASQVQEACKRLLSGGLIVNVDLMYGLPGQSQESFQSDLEEIAGLGVHGFTLYDLRTTDRKSIGRSLSEEERLDLARLMRWRLFVSDLTAGLGFSQVRWHTFKKLDGLAALHERLPTFDDQMRGYQPGIGMSARSHIGHAVYRNHHHMREYMERIEAGSSPVEQVFRLGPEDLRTQFVARSLGDGKILDRCAYEAAFGSPIERDYGEILQRMLSAELMVEIGDGLALSPLGRLVYDRVLLNFYPKHAKDWLWANAA